VLTDALILAGLTDVAHVVGDHLLLTRGRRTVRDASVRTHGPDLGALGAKRAAFEAQLSRHVGQNLGAWEGSQGAPMHPGIAAVLEVQKAIAHCVVPSVQIRYAGMHRSSGSGGHGITEGVIDVHVAYRTARGVDHVVQVPVYVRAGRLQRPTVMIDQGVTRLLAQPAFDETIGRFEYPQTKPSRPMYSPPGVGGASPFWS
jgi:hypothetical protein